ncbi:unnamed protein product [Arctogadus glacialis]
MDLFTGAGLIQLLCGRHPTPKHPTSENTNIKEESPAKTIQLQGFQYVIYIDSELEHVRKHYFEMKIIGRGGQCELSKELTCRLVRHTVTNMVSVIDRGTCLNKGGPQSQEGVTNILGPTLSINLKLSNTVFVMLAVCMLPECIYSIFPIVETVPGKSRLVLTHR